MVARFDSVPDAVGAGRAPFAAAEVLGIEIRGLVHLGDWALVGDDLAGRTVHEAARISVLASPGELLVLDVARGCSPARDARHDPGAGRA